MVFWSVSWLLNIYILVFKINSAKYYVKFLNLAPESFQFSHFVVPPKFHKTFDKALKAFLKPFQAPQSIVKIKI